jgi:hypothetical protein
VVSRLSPRLFAHAVLSPSIRLNSVVYRCYCIPCGGVLVHWTVCPSVIVSRVFGVAVALDAAGNPRGTGFARFINRKHGEAAIMGLHGKVCAVVQSVLPQIPGVFRVSISITTWIPRPFVDHVRFLRLFSGSTPYGRRTCVLFGAFGRRAAKYVRVKR